MAMAMHYPDPLCSLVRTEILSLYPQPQSVSVHPSPESVRPLWLHHWSLQPAAVRLKFLGWECSSRMGCSVGAGRTASCSFRALKRGRHRKGKRPTQAGGCPPSPGPTGWLLRDSVSDIRYSTASHILEALEAGGCGTMGAGTSGCIDCTLSSGSGNAGCSASSISCFFRRVQPLRQGLGATLGTGHWGRPKGPEAAGRLETCLGSMASLAVGSSSRCSASGAAGAGL